MSRRHERSGLQRRGISPMMIMLGMQIYQHLERIEHKPPVTIALLICNILPHLYHMNLFDFSLSDVNQNCVNPRIIMTSLVQNHQLQLNRIILPGFMHADDTHLYYNMLSLLWKGINLERVLGSTKFLHLVIFSLICSHTLMVMLAYILHEIGLDPSISGYNTCAIGFSAVLFSLKYVWNHMSPGNSNVMGIMLPSKYAAWFELVLISIISPQVSFLGHLCGIFAGVLYVHVLQYLFNRPTPLSTSSSSSSYTSNAGSRYTYASGTASSQSAPQHDVYQRNRAHPVNPEPSTSTSTSRTNPTPSALPAPSDADIRRLRLNRLNLRYT